MKYKSQNLHASTRTLRYDQQVIEQIPQVRLIAKMIRDRFKPTAAFDDLIGYGMIGLMNAANRFDSSRGVLFKTYAATRIRGAILDGLRTMNWLSKSACRRKTAFLKKMAKAEYVGSRSGSKHLRQSPPLLDIVCDGFDLQSLDTISARSAFCSAISDPARLYERKELSSHLGMAISKLPVRERTILYLYYFRDWTMRAIGERLEMHPARISQLHSRAISELRKHLFRPTKINHQCAGCITGIQNSAFFGHQAAGGTTLPSFAQDTK